MVSIIIPTYNRAGTLGRAVESVLRQTHGDWEIIIVDDGSTDGTPEVVAGYTNGRIRMIRHSENRGAPAAKNTGLDAMRGQWFTILDSDDEMTPDALALMLDYARRTGANAITCNCLDTSTGAMSGSGPVGDGWLSTTDAAACRGEHWGITSTALLGELRFDPRRSGTHDTLWLKVNAIARRYYVHRALRIYHTEGSDRITVVRRGAGLRQKVQDFSVIGEDAEYLRELRVHDPQEYRRTIVRVWAARVLDRLLSWFGRSLRS